MKALVCFIISLLALANCQADEEQKGQVKTSTDKSSAQIEVEEKEQMKKRIDTCFEAVFLGEGNDPEHLLNVNARNTRQYTRNLATGQIIVSGIENWGEEFGQVEVTDIETCECLLARKIQVGVTNGDTQVGSELQFLLGNVQDEKKKLYTITAKERGLVTVKRVPDKEIAETEETATYDYCKLKITITPDNENIAEHGLMLGKRFGVDIEPFTVKQ